MNFFGTQIIHPESLIDTQEYLPNGQCPETKRGGVSQYSRQDGPWVNGGSILVRGAEDRGSSYLNDLDAVCAKRVVIVSDVGVQSKSSSTG